MMAVPVLMTLFTDDAAEVRYSDQSCLQLSPCGSTFVHHESPGQLIHPAHGMKTISQRCEFVTSDYKQKVLQALDFRNRFAERPFVCQSLITADQVMSLYARITTAAWPRGLQQANFEYMADGGIRLISEDEFSSIMLSPHKQDFTICYLCGISLDTPRKKLGSLKQQKVKTLATSCLKKNTSVGNSAFCINKCSQHDKQIRNYVDSESAETRNLINKNQEKTRDDLNFSPISFASTQLSRESSPIDDSKTEYKRYSTPTNLLPPTKCDKRKAKNDTFDGSFLQYSDKGNSIPKTCQSADNTVCSSNASNLSIDSKHSSDSDSSNSQKHVHWTSTSSGGSDKSDVGKLDDQSSQLLYTWVTRHYSSEECPASWNHVLNMARAALDNREQLEEYSSATSVHINQKPKGIPKKIDPEKFWMTPLPDSLPLTCPGQHLHKQYGKYVHDSGKDLVENITSLSKGKLKIILIDGIVFRIVRHSSTKFVEIYPGDGSVILSQGLGGHFYRHIIPKGSMLDERTYSLKAPPPTPRSALYSIEKLIKRASRFLLQTNQEDKTITDKLPCWKYNNDSLIEPLAASLLEECTVPGHGRFSAFSNGHVRILFDDRTALDMSCDFSKRILGCMEHSKDPKEKAVLRQQLEQQCINVQGKGKQGLCKLLLPNGQYQIVDSKKPGIYKKYTDAALEWAAWVNSSPNQRKIFYQNWNQEDDTTLMVAKELQKIQCFNYLAESALSSARDSDLSSEAEQHSAITSELQSILKHSARDHQQHHKQSLKIVSHDASDYSSQNFHSHSSHGNESQFQSGVRRNNLSYLNSNPTRELEMIRGFDSVREALLRTSNAIKDIDEIIEKKDKKS